MKFLIAGYGRVGRRTARVLQSEGHQVMVVENDPEKVAQAVEDGFTAVEGDAQSEEALKQAGIEDADAVGGLTGDLNVNYAVCMIGKTFGCRTVLRIDEDYREEIYGTYAADVDEILYPERLGAAGAKNALLGGDLNVLADLTESLTATTVNIPPDSPVLGTRVVEIDVPEDARIYAHGRKNEPMTIPMPHDTIEAGDQVAFIAGQDGLAELSARLRGT